jgi:hypothetical protein
MAADDDTTLNSASATSVRKRRKSAAAREREARERLQRLLENDDFKRVAWELVAWCGVLTQVDIESTNRVLVNEGKRSIGLKLIAALEAARPNALELLRAAHFNQKDQTHGN